MASFNWLHLTDLHLGMAEQPRLLPVVRDRFFEDLKALREKCGPWDLVLFTGDLAQSGSAEEFRRVDEFLDLLWSRLRELDSQPQLLAVPGNHDLTRPDPKDLSVKLLRTWKADSDLREEFWKNLGSPYRATVSECFANYMEWWNKTPFKPPAFKPGMLPGDFSAIIEKEGFSLGIVGLNTTFLQLGGGDYKGSLALDACQFQEVCDGDGPAWVKKRHACLLLTHQPPDWLTTEAEAHLKAEIAGYDYFALHLFGHMHEARYRSAAEGGGPTCRTSQGSSLFGLEYFGEEQKLERSHGYAAGTLQIDDGEGRLIVWPRQASRPGGQWHFAANNVGFILTDEHTKPEEIRLLNAIQKVPLDPGLRQDPMPPAGERPFPNQWAVLIGADDYQYVTKLRYCGKDVMDLADIFRRSLGFHPECVFEFHEKSDLKPQRNLIFRKLAELPGTINPDDLLVFYFSGHGITIADKDYLLPIEASPRDARNLGIRVDDLVEALQETHCKNIAMFVDACRETVVEGTKGTVSIGEYSKGAVSRAGIVTFFSCDPKDRSYEIEPLEHGSFTYCILQAIQDGAATTVAELDRYLRENVPQINTKYNKPPQQPYTIIEPAERGKLPILFNPLRSQQAAQEYEPLIKEVASRFANDEIKEDDFIRMLEFLDQMKSKRPPLAGEDRIKLTTIQSLCAGRIQVATFRTAWLSAESRRPSGPQVKKLPRLN